MEGRSHSEVARAYGLSQPWVSGLVGRYRAEGEAACEARSRRPGSSPTATDPAVVDLVLRLRRDLTGRGLDAGAHTICWHLREHHDLHVSAATAWRILFRAGQVVPDPGKRAKSSYRRFEADLPNQTWQTAFTHWTLADGRHVELDDHSRYLLAATAHRPVTGPVVVAAFRQVIDRYGTPAAVLSDNGWSTPPGSPAAAGAGRPATDSRPSLRATAWRRRTPARTIRRPAEGSNASSAPRRSCSG
jgi:transposase InsO family protein